MFVPFEFRYTNLKVYHFYKFYKNNKQRTIYILFCHILASHNEEVILLLFTQNTYSFIVELVIT